MDDFKFPGFHSCPEGDSLHWDGRGMELNALDLLDYRLLASDKTLTISGSRNLLKLA